MKLPDKFENKQQLKNMAIGQSGYITPWGMWVDLVGNCWLNENYTYNSTPGGTVQLKITKVKDGYIAHVHEMKYDYTWTRQSTPTHNSPTEICYGRVVGFELSQSFNIEQISADSVQPQTIVNKLKSFFNWN